MSEQPTQPTPAESGSTEHVPVDPIWIPWAGHPYADPWSTDPATTPPVAQHRGRWIAAVAAAALLGAGGVLGIQYRLQADAADAAQATAPSGTGLGGAVTAPVDPGSGSSDSGTAGNGFGFTPGGGSVGADPFGDDSGGTTPASAASTTPATAAQQVGVVDITTVLGPQGARAAGTGMVLTADGEILTNNHVIAGATKISVTVVSTGQTYAASVVGYSVTRDVAVLQLDGASGLETVHLAGSTPSVGAAVVGVGNAGGVGGTPSAAAGTVTALDQEITARDDSGGSEQLTGLIQTDAAIAAGDSGGPLYDSSDQVVGMDTAASAGGATQGFAIPIANALSVADQIEAGQGSSSVHIGTTAFLGIKVQERLGAQVAGVVAGSPAADAGLVAGDVITSIDGRAVTSAASVSAVLGPLAPGDQVVVGWTDRAGQAHHATVTLAAGPAQ